MQDYEDIDEDFLDEEQSELDSERYEHYRFEVDKGQKPLRIDLYLHDKIVNISRSKVQNAAKNESILVNGSPVKSNYKVRPNDLIQVVLDNPKVEHVVEAENLDLEIIFEDEDIIIINKPAGMVVHPGHGNYTGTLVNGLMHLKKHWPDINGANRPGIVHRLDKNTSGAIIAGKTERALHHLSKQFADRTVEREYVALVWGDVVENKGRIEGNITRNPNNRLKFQVDRDGLTGKWAATNYEVIQRYGYVTLVKCTLETGRTHQIRVHMKSIGHPLFNDTTYGGDQVVFGTVFTKYKQFVENCFKLIPAQALHAKKIGFQHPTTGEQMKYNIPLPDGFKAILEKWQTYTQALQVNKSSFND